MSVLGFAAPRHHGITLPSFPTQHHPTTTVDTYMNALRRWRTHRNDRCCVVRFRLFHPPGSDGAAAGWMFFRRVAAGVCVCVDVWVLVQRDQLPVPLFLSRFYAFLHPKLVPADYVFFLVFVSPVRNYAKTLVTWFQKLYVTILRVSLLSCLLTNGCQALSLSPQSLRVWYLPLLLTHLLLC